MQSFDQLLDQFRIQDTSDPRLQPLVQLLRSSEGQALAHSLSPQTAQAITQAAQAAQQGDLTRAQAAVQAVLHTPEGAQLAARLKGLLRQP